VTLEPLKKSSFLSNMLVKQLGYYSDDLLAFENGNLVKATKNDKRIVILAKNHYQETWQTFSSISKSELNKILALKKASTKVRSTIYQIEENTGVDGYDVKTIAIDLKLLERLGEKNVYIPETELFCFEDLYEIETPLGNLYSSIVGNKRYSAYAKGLVADVNTYKLSIGLPMGTKVKVIKSVDFPRILLENLYRQSINELLNKSLFNFKKWIPTYQMHWLYGGPILSAALFYLVTSLYISLQIHNVEGYIEDGGSQTSLLLERKREADQKSQLVNAVSGEFGNRQLVHGYWNILDTLLESEATITRISLNKQTLTVRGTADKASKVLARISEDNSVKNAYFDGPVRNARGQEAFILKISPKA